MARPADYRFFFQYKNSKIQVKAIIYNVCISPNKNQLEIVSDSDGYAHLNKENSSILFETLTRENLFNLK